MQSSKEPHLAREPYVPDPWLRVLASHTGSLGSVAQGAWKLEDLPMGRCHFLSDPCVFGYIF